MTGWKGGMFTNPKCPNGKCEATFKGLREAVDPRTSSVTDVFNFVNRSGSGRVTKDELAEWYTANFQISRDSAARVINDNWESWDVPRSRSFFRLGFMRSKDQGDLDKDEFEKTQEYMKKAYAPIVSATVYATGVAAADVSGSSAQGLPQGQKRSQEFLEGFQRNVQGKKLTTSEELQKKLRDSNARGRAWFDEFDRDGNGQLDKKELITALLQTFMGSYNMTRDVITETVNHIWEAIDTDGGGSVCFDEFQPLRESLVAQMNQDQLPNRVAGISPATEH